MVVSLVLGEGAGAVLLQRGDAEVRFPGVTRPGPSKSGAMAPDRRGVVRLLSRPT